jgi:hypothetical protein
MARYTSPKDPDPIRPTMVSGPHVSRVSVSGSVAASSWSSEVCRDDVNVEAGGKLA